MKGEENVEFLGNWIIGITAAGLIFSAVLALAPEGNAKRVVRLAGGACVLLATFLPLSSLDADNFLPSAYAASDEYADALSELGRTNYDLQKNIIEQRISSYIQAKADALGLDITVAVGFEDRDGSPYPISTVIEWSGDGSAVDELADYVESSLGIDRASQTVKERQP